MLRSLCILALGLLSIVPAWSQTEVQGVVVEAGTELTLPGASVLAFGPDSTQTGVAADPDGFFRLSLPPGDYRLRVSFIGYRTGELALTVGEAAIDLGRLPLRPDTTALGETVVEAIATRVILRGDTTVFNADAYAVNPDATVGDLLRKLPGLTVNGGEVRANGEAVDRVLVDGKEFFGDDPAAALDNLPADAVEEVQVYDRQSDRAELTGFDDGEEERTINVVTRPERRRSLFGRGQLGLGTDVRYVGGGNVNLFDGDRRVSVFGRANNLDFRTQAALDGGDRQPGPQVFRFRDGISETVVGGVNYNDEWGEGIEVSASYSASLTDNTRDVRLSREYLLTEAAGQRFAEATDAERTDLNHDVFARLEATLSERTELEVQTHLEAQGSEDAASLAATTARPGGALLNRSLTDSEGNSHGLEANLTTELRHRFAREGRTLSGELVLGTDGSGGDSAQDLERLFFGDDGTTLDSSDVFTRSLDDRSLTRSVRGEIAYSEPLGERFQLLVAYRPSLSVLDVDREGLRLGAGATLPVLDSTVTSFTDQRLTRHTLGSDLQHRRDGFSATVGLAVRTERVAFTQAGPRPFDVARRTWSLLPSVRTEIKMGEQATLNLSYRSNTDVPEPLQLRDVVDDTNPLALSTGNPDLRTARTHSISAFFRRISPAEGRSFMINGQATVTLDHIGAARVAAGGVPVTARGVVVPAGGQLTYPVNLDGYVRAWTFIGYGRPVAPLKSNLNVFASLGYTRSPSLIDDVLNRSDALSASVNLSLGTSTSERFDLTTTLGLNAQKTINSLGGVRSPDYLRPQVGFDLTWLPGGGLKLTSALDASYTPDLGADLDPLAMRMDLGIGYKFMAGERAEARVAVVDVFDQAESVGRQVTDLYVEDRETQVLGRFVFASLTYTIRPAGGAQGGRGIPPPGVIIGRF